MQDIQDVQLTKSELQERLRLRVLGFLDALDFNSLPSIQELRTTQPEDYQRLLAFCNYVSSHPSWPLVLKALTGPLGEYALMKSKDYDEVTFMRATVNGLNLLTEFLEDKRKEFESLSAGQQGLLSEDERHRSFSSVTR